jgi:hypothetical protein
LYQPQMINDGDWSNWWNNWKGKPKCWENLHQHHIVLKSHMTRPGPQRWEASD